MPFPHLLACSLVLLGNAIVPQAWGGASRNDVLLMASLSAKWAHQVSQSGLEERLVRSAHAMRMTEGGGSMLQAALPASCHHMVNFWRPHAPACARSSLLVYLLSLQDAIDRAVTAAVGGSPKAIAGYNITRLIPFNPVDKKTVAEVCKGQPQSDGQASRLCCMMRPATPCRCPACTLPPIHHLQSRPSCCR